MQLQRWLRFGLGLWLFVATGGLGGEAVAQVSFFPNEVQRLDVISIQQDGRDLYAFSSVTGSRPRIRLDIDEQVVFNESRGRVGIVLTDRRALGVTIGGSFQEVRYTKPERAPELALVSQSIALVATKWRALAFLAENGVWITENLTPAESVESLRIGASVGIATTNRRALGISPDVGRFASLEFNLRESIESIDAGDTLATLRTDQRIMVFSGPGASWTFRSRDID